MISKSYDEIIERVRDTLVLAGSTFRPDKTEAFKRAIETESNPQAKWILETMLENAEVAGKNHRPICDDTGIPHFLLEIGEDTPITGKTLDAIKEGTDNLREGVVQVKSSVDNVIDANKQIMDNITNLSATSEEVAAAADTVGGVSDDAMEALSNMNETLDVINKIAKEMEEMAMK